MFVEDRLNSFSPWPHKNTKKMLGPAQLSKMGFYLDKTLTCSFCKLDSIDTDPHPLVNHDCLLSRVWSSALSSRKVKWAKNYSVLDKLDQLFEGWPHKGTKKKPTTLTKENMAHAGFIFSPTEEGSDCVICPWCDLELDGWEEGDDPVHEHQKRTKKCPFFALEHESVQKMEEESVSEVVEEERPKRRKKEAKPVKSKKQKVADVEEPETEEADIPETQSKDADIPDTESKEAEIPDTESKEPETKEQETKDQASAEEEEVVDEGTVTPMIEPEQEPVKYFRPQRTQRLPQKTKRPEPVKKPKKTRTVKESKPEPKEPTPEEPSPEEETNDKETKETPEQDASQEVDELQESEETEKENSNPQIAPKKLEKIEIQPKIVAADLFAKPRVKPELVEFVQKYAQDWHDQQFLRDMAQRNPKMSVREYLLTLGDAAISSLERYMDDKIKSLS